MWRFARGKHEATQRLIYDLIANLIPSFQAPTINAFYECIESMSVKSLNIYTLDFIKEFAIEAALSTIKVKDKKKKPPE